MHRTALIIGAGIGGLSAAIALRQHDWNVRVFEQAASARELGFGVAVAPNAVAALRKLGVADTVIAHGFEPRRAEVRRPNGAVLKRAELPPGALGGPMLVALRSALHGALFDAVGTETIALRRRLAGFTQRGDRVTASFADGSAIDGDLLIGADGIGSTVRSVMHPDERPPRDSGITAIRGAVHGALHHLASNDAIYYLGPGIESALVRASDTGIYWFLSLARTLVPPDRRDAATILAALSPRFDATFRAVTSATEDLRVDDLVDRDPLPVWSRGIVTLLGDAAHPLLPHTGQGAAQAMVDATELASALASGHSVEQSLQSYERERLPKTAALLAQGRRTAWVMASTNPVMSAMLGMVIRAIPVTSFARVYVRINRRAGTDVRSI